MARHSLRDICVLAARRKTLHEQCCFFLQGLVFFPFLKLEELREARDAGNQCSASAAGDDVYPLF